MNSLAQIQRTVRSQIDPAKIFNIKRRELTAPFEPASIDPTETRHGHDDEEEHSHDHSEDEEHHHHHDDEVRSLSLADDRPLDLKKVEAWLSEIINTMGERLYRSKGILYIKGEPKRVVFQGVQTMFEARPDRLWNVNEKRTSQMVFIGKDLDEAKIRAGFASCTTG